jgi:hypothetical protein
MVQIKNKERSTDRILVLKPKEGGAKEKAGGQTNNRLFRGSNNIHAIMNPKTCLWYLRYDDGMLQAPLKQRFVSFEDAYKFTKNFFAKRNVDIAEVID